MFEVTLTDGTKTRIGRRLLEQLRMMMDWQVRECGYELASITRACLDLDLRDEEVARGDRPGQSSQWPPFQW